MARRGGEILLQPGSFEWAGPELSSFTGRYGGLWQIQWNAFTRTPHLVLGTGVPWAPGDITSAEAAEDAAGRFLEGNSVLIGTGAAELRPTHTAHALGKWSVIFQQYWRGLPVMGGPAQGRILSR